jgi:hypothetical protein
VYKSLGILLLIGVAVPSKAQVLVTPSGVSNAKGLIDANSGHDTLNCEVHHQNPVLDFGVRYEATFVVSADMSQFNPGDVATSYLRVSPQDGSPVYLSEVYTIPPLASEQGATDTASIRSKLLIRIMSGFDLGEGHYGVDFVLVDRHSQSCHRHWTLQTPKYTGPIPIALSPHTVAPISPPVWDGKLDPNGIRLDVLIDAEPSNSGAARLDPVDDRQLLYTLATLLRNVPIRSVQVVAFNLEQQAEIFREREFSSPDFADLDNALQHLDLNVTSYQALQRGGTQAFLLKLASEPDADKNPFDAVAFIGARAQGHDNPQAQPLTPTASKFFYFEFDRAARGLPMATRHTNPYDPMAGAIDCASCIPPDPSFDHEVPVPDSLERLTKALHGSVFHIESAKDLALSIPKMLTQIRSGASSQAVSHGN